MLGKRKRETQVVSKPKTVSQNHESANTSTINTNDIFRQYFEAQFAPLPEQQVIDVTDEDEDESDGSGDESDGSEWSGITDTAERVTVVEVIDHVSNQVDEEDELHRARQKAFMSAKPPREVTNNPAPTAGSNKPTAEEELSERVNLKHDLDLQRLLKESHLLERSRVSSTPGKERQKALDMRLQALGAKESLFSQKKMPVAHRVGIVKKADMKETRRRHEAKENGVILEKVSMKKGAKHKSGRRERGVDAPVVGKFSGGTLKLSRKDVANIQGPPAAARRGKRR